MTISHCMFCNAEVVVSAGFFVQHSRLRDDVKCLCLGSGTPVFYVSRECC